jgi:hypothetical protein
MHKQHYHTIAFIITSIVTCTLAIQVPISLPSLKADIRHWTDGYDYSELFPGKHTFNKVLFNLTTDAQGNTGFWQGHLDIPVNLFVRKVYTIINSACGETGATIGLMQFHGHKGARHTVKIVEGVNVRDHFNGGFCNVIDNRTTILAWKKRNVRFDMQTIPLPQPFASQMLTKVVFKTNRLGCPVGEPLLTAMTVDTIQIKADTCCPGCSYGSKCCCSPKKRDVSMQHLCPSCGTSNQLQRHPKIPSKYCCPI